MSRNIQDVLEDVLKVVPEDREWLRANLRSVISSALLIAPEVTYEHWRRALVALIQERQQHEQMPPWLQQAHFIFAGLDELSREDP